MTGLVEPGFERVRDAFAANFEAGHEVGAALCVHHDGRKVVDIVGGSFDRDGTKPYGSDTLQLVFSSTKGATAVCANLLAQRGLLDLDEPVATYWPEFAQGGKGRLPVRYLLSHQAGLPAIDRTLTPEEVWAWDPVIEALAEQAPFWEPGTAHGYHALTYGYLVGEVVRRITGRSLGSFFADEVAEPLGLEFFIGLPEDARAQGFTDRGRAHRWCGPGLIRILLDPPGPGAQHGRGLPRPGLDESSRLARRRGAGRQRHHRRDVALTDVRGPHRHGGGWAVGTAPDQGPGRAARTPLTFGQDQVFASVGLPLEQKIGLGFWRASPAATWGGAGSFGHAGPEGRTGSPIPSTDWRWAT